MAFFLTALLIGLIGVALFGVPHLIIWVAQGLFNVDWHSKYWYVFAAWFILGLLFGNSSKSKD